MAIRVTQVILQVLHQGKSAQENAIGTLQYKHDYNALDGFVDADYAVEIGIVREGSLLQSSYFLAGFEQQESTPLSSQYDLDAFLQQENVILQGNYTLEVLLPVDGALTSAYALNAFVILDGQHYSNYDLNAYVAKEMTFGSEYELQLFLLAEGFMNSLYSVDVYLELLMQAVSSYDLNIYVQNDNAILSSTFDLDALEAREFAIGSHYALLTFIQSDGFLDASYKVEVLKALEEKYGVNYSLNAFEQLNGFTDSRYKIEVLQLAELGFGSHYLLDIFKAFDGFVDSTAVLNAYQQANGFTDAQYGISIYLAREGFLDSAYDLQALLAANGYMDGTYLLDTTQELFAWVINHNTGAPSRYENYDFDAFAVIGEDFLAARGDGIYLLTGDDDNGADIDAIATIGRTDFEEPVLKRVTAAFLGLNSAGQAHLTIRTDQGITTGPYKLRQAPAASTTERAKFRRGIKSRYWEFDIENVLGGDLQVKSAEFETIILGEKRLKK